MTPFPSFPSGAKTSPGWPRELAGLGPAGEVVRVGNVKITTPGKTGTFVQYASIPLCLPHALQREAAGGLAAVISELDGEIVERRPR